MKKFKQKEKSSLEYARNLAADIAYEKGLERSMEDFNKWGEDFYFGYTHGSLLALIDCLGVKEVRKMINDLAK